MNKKIILFLLLAIFLFAKEVPILFYGNEHVDTNQLYTVLNLYKPYFYEFWKKQPRINIETLTLAKEAIKNYYRSIGFYHVLISTKKNKNGITVIIKEGKPIHIQTITVLSKFDLSAYVPFRKGMIFDALKFGQSKKDIKHFYDNQGYCKASLDAKAWIDIKLNRAYIAYDTTANKPCHFGKIVISAPKDIDAKILKSLLYFKKNELYSLDKVSSSYKNYYAHEGISNAVIKTSIQNNNDVNVSVIVSETKKPIRFQTGIGISSDEGLVVSLGVKNRNFLGNLKTLELDTKYTQLKQDISLNYSMPLLDRRSTGASLEYSQEKYLGFKENKFLGTVFLKQRRSKMVFQESLISDFTKIYDSDDLLVYPEGNFFLPSAKLSWVYDTRDNFLSPTRGYFIRTELMGSLKSSISDATYYKYNLTGAYIFPILPSVVALKANYGSLHVNDGSVPATYRFFAGGMTSNRAYGYRKLGPVDSNGDPKGLNSVLELTAEYRFPIYGDFRGVIFSDNTYIGEQDTPDMSVGYHSAGFGLRYKTPIGPIAFDFGIDLKKPSRQYAFHFRIGELF